ncbi:PilX N-terminal domain-containing pilus assembly protein [Dasania sp. GY-MA-18]|uniref:PilX N-terminal domain-containing pilus assembly protein n=1 Tax=Dasania phycosphaerae TaxID=2950436 RepID=A0A9J6RPC5_9GAMM|nr:MULTISPECIES: PilX N-terminal domain-containing pilus assembly protein [Dasania]MCR8923598.1 PilX N-terminal domain-containing pilus assembly protein [Dasania sp. GY-MA-18]MCZ0866032.1 PilX N-terminal domain-containing pilus assembly protein [Dasania phycosphaerae]MCZ0869756.1 PilX N-terminal domain-containing pilus assembly protein [Dasania phycosphaerae]
MQTTQRGAVLIISLIIMLVMTAAALSSSRGILLQEKMTGSVRESYLAFQAAEAALADAEEYLDTIVTTGDFNDNGTGGLYNTGMAPYKTAMFGHANWSSATQHVVATTATSTNVPAGKYMIELVNKNISDKTESGSSGFLNMQQEYTSQGAEVKGFRVTARGESRDGRSVRIIQSYYGVRL